MKLKSYSPLFEVYVDWLFLRAVICLRLPVPTVSVIPVLDKESWIHVCTQFPGLDVMRMQLELSMMAVCICRVPLNFAGSGQVNFHLENRFDIEPSGGELWKLIFVQQQ